jgi:hypothetical protein
VPSQQLQGQLQTQHSVYTGNDIKDKHSIKTAIYNSNNNNNNNNNNVTFLVTVDGVLD